MKQLILGFILVFSVTISLFSQVKIGNNPLTINSNSILEIESTDKGLLVPRIALTSLNSALPMNAHVEGMIVYNTASTGTFPNQVVPGYYMNDGMQWQQLLSTAAQLNNYGDVKQGFQTTDHAGWYLLDGRALSGLSANAQLAAASLGFSGNLPDSRNKFLQHGNTLGATGGASGHLVKILQSNLPLVDFTGLADSSGNHDHEIDPPNTVTDEEGSHNHTVDPPNTATTIAGLHNHNGLAANDDASNSSSQGWPQGNVHESFRSSREPRQRIINPLAISSAGNHSHTVNISAFVSSSAGLHTHGVNIESFNSATSAKHIHEVKVSSGGADADLNITPEYLSINNFIYLGQ